jgi:hypothetical protein
MVCGVGSLSKIPSHTSSQNRPIHSGSHGNSWETRVGCEITHRGRSIGSQCPDLGPGSRCISSTRHSVSPSLHGSTMRLRFSMPPSSDSTSNTWWIGPLVLTGLRLLTLEARLAHAKAKGSLLVFNGVLAIRTMFTCGIVGFTIGILLSIGHEETWLLAL